MPGALNLAGGQPTNKPPKYACIHSSRSYSGIVTNRSPLRSSGSAYEERWLGTRTDALIDGSNCEITPKLTLARRPGNPVYNSNIFSNVDFFYAFIQFGPNGEQIQVIVDQANGVYNGTANQDTLIFAKSAGAGQTFFQSVGNNLFFGDGVDQQKFVTSLITRTNSANPLPNIGDTVALTPSTPFLTTYFLDANGNLEQLLSTKITTVTNVIYAAPTLTLTVGSTASIAPGNNYVLWHMQAALWLNGMTINVVTAAGTTVTATLVHGQHANYGSTSDTGDFCQAIGGAPVTAAAVPSFSMTVPASGNNFQGGFTDDGTAVWVNRGGPLENWGIAAGTTAPIVTVGTSGSAWKANTYYSLLGDVIDSNGRLQQVTTAGLSGTVTPTWATVDGNTTTDGTVVWTQQETVTELTWAPGTVYNTPGQVLLASAAGTNCLFQMEANTYPVFKLVAGNYVVANFYAHNSAFSGQCELRFGSLTSHTSGPTGGTSCLFNPPQFNGTADPNVQPLEWAILDGSGRITGYTVPYASATSNYNMVVTFTLTVPVAGQYSFTINHDDGMFWGIGNSAQRISGPNICPAPAATQTAVNGYTLMGANNVAGNNSDAFVVNFPTAGDYPVEIDYCQFQTEQNLCLYCNGQTPVPGAAITGTTQPIWPTWSTAFAPGYPTVNETNNSAPGGGNGPGPIIWRNLGPAVDYTWQAKTNFTLPNTVITDPHNNSEAAYRTGVSGAMVPTFATGINQLTNDNPNLIWINQGPASSPAVGTISAFNGGYQYVVALVNTMTDTVSNASPLSIATGNFIGATGILITGGLPPLASIDPQSDFVAIFRTTDGQTTPFLIPGTTNSIFTVPLSQYLQNGYLDTTPDTGLNNLIEAPILGENTPPSPGAVNLAFFLSRIFFSIGNSVFFTSGPDTPVGNGFEGVLGTNTFTLPSQVIRMVPTTVGLFVFTISDIYIIVGSGTTTSPVSIFPYLAGIGLLSYNALDVNGSDIGFFSTDARFIILNPSSGISDIGQAIGNLLGIAANWNPKLVYVTWYSSGEDSAWYLANGSTGWYRVSPTPAPEQGITWSPFATIVGGVKAVQSIQVSPGVKKLLLGPASSGPILNRSLTSWLDGTSSYSWFAVQGSLVLTNPGQLAEIAFITIESVATGTPPSVSVILDECVPFFTGPFEVLSNPVSDPPTAPVSTSTYSQRWYLSESGQPAIARHMQIRYDLPAENFLAEILTTSVFGAVLTEQ
jgi:hypothetical protein